MWKFLCGLLWCAALLGVVNADEDPTITIRLGIIDTSTYVLSDGDRDLTCDKKPGSTAKSRTFNYVVSLKKTGEVDLKNFANPGVECIWEYNRCLKHSERSVAFRGLRTNTKFRTITVRGIETPETVFVTLKKSGESHERFVVTDAQVDKKGAIIKRHIPFVINRPTKRDLQTLRIQLPKLKEDLSVSVRVGTKQAKEGEEDESEVNEVEAGEGEAKKTIKVPCETFVGLPPLVGDWSEASEDQNSLTKLAKGYTAADIDAVAFVLAAHDNGDLYCIVGKRWADRININSMRNGLGGNHVSPEEAVEVLVGKGLERVGPRKFKRVDGKVVLEGFIEPLASRLPVGLEVQDSFKSQFYLPGK